MRTQIAPAHSLWLPTHLKEDTMESLSQPLTAAELAALDEKRLRYIKSTVMRGVRNVFFDHPEIHSATLLVSQYWDDEAADAVHATVVFSVLDTPNLDAHFDAQIWDEESNEWGTDTVNLAGLELDFWSYWEGLHWDDNNEAIPLFAAFCVPGSQDRSSLENCRPFCVFRRDGDDEISIEVVGTRYRPWLDDVAPEELY